MATGETTDPRDRLIEALRRENAELKAHIVSLEARIAQLERKLEEALRAQKRQAAPFSKGPPKANPKRRGRRAGAKYGKRARREPPEHINEIVHVPFPSQCDCGGPIKFDRTVHQFQTEIPRKPIHRRFDIDLGHCTRCGKRHRGRHPLQTSDAVGAAAPQLGPDAQAMTALLKDEVGVSYGDIKAVFQRFFGIALSPGGAAQMVVRVAQRLKAAYRGIEIVVHRSRVVYPDETGWKVAGWLQWLWVFVVRTAVLFRIRPSRGYDVPEEVLGPDWSGDMVHDGWSPYDRFENADHQQCLGHIERRCERILQGATRGAVRFPRAVLELTQDAFRLRDRRDRAEVSPHGVAVAVGRLQSRLEGLLWWRLSNPVNARLAGHLAKHRDELFVFLKKPWLEATSWPADHAIRPAVANRKVFGGNRDPSGAMAQEILSSILATGLKRGVDVFGYISRILRAPADLRDALACRLLRLPAPT